VSNSVFVPVCLASDHATFESNCVKTNKDRHILSAAHIFGNDSSFWQCKVCADIRASSVDSCQLKASSGVEWDR